MDPGDEFDPLAVVFPMDDRSPVGTRSGSRGSVPALSSAALDAAPAAGSAPGSPAPARETVLRLAPSAFPTDAILKPVFRDFEQSGVRWCLIGAETLPGRAGEEVTVLLERPSLGAAKSILTANGFAGVPVWGAVPGGVAGGETLPRGEGTQRFVGYSPDEDTWVTLFLTYRLTFSAYGGFETGAEGGCLERRRWESGVYLLGLDDAFWSLLLHLVLDPASPPDPRVPARRGLGGRGAPSPDADRPHLFGMERPAAFSSLERLVVEARTDGPLARLVAGLLPPHWTPEHVVDCVWEGEWDTLLTLGTSIQAAWMERRTWAARRRAFKCRLAHRISVRPWMEGFFSSGPGFSVALLAPDLAGKAALARDLGRTFYLPVTYVRMGAPPRRRGRSGRIARAGFCRTLVAYWRRYLIGRLRRARGRLVVFDRYTYDARLPAVPRGQPPEARLARARRLVLGHACPAPDLVAVLDEPALFTTRRARASARGPGGVELTPGALRRQYLDLAQRIPDAIVAEARLGEQELRREVTAQIWRAYAAAPPRLWLRCARRLRRPWRTGR